MSTDTAERPKSRKPATCSKLCRNLGQTERPLISLGITIPISRRKLLKLNCWSSKVLVKMGKASVNVRNSSKRYNEAAARVNPNRNARATRRITASSDPWRRAYEGPKWLHSPRGKLLERLQHAHGTFIKRRPPAVHAF